MRTAKHAQATQAAAALLIEDIANHPDTMIRLALSLADDCQDLVRNCDA